MKKTLELQPIMTKNPKLTDFLRFYATFVKYLGDFMKQNVDNVQQRSNLLSNRVFHGHTCSELK